MTAKSDVIASGAAFRDQLSRLANDGHYSDPEKDGFRLLHLFYADRLASFQVRPRYGDESEFYQNPKHWADVGLQASAACKPGDVASQQPVYDAANNGGDSLETVTLPISGFSFSNMQADVTRAVAGLQGSLLATRSLS